MMNLEPEKLKSLMRSIFCTSEREIGCDTCYEQLDRFAELSLAGRDAPKLMPLVYRHLQICSACHEEFDALLRALRRS